MSLSRYFLDIEDRVPVKDIVVYNRGAVVNGVQNDVNTVTIHSDSDFAVSDKFLYAQDRTNVITDRVFTVSAVTATTVQFSGDTFSFPDKSLLVPLGTDTVAARADGSWPLPEWDGSPLTVYQDPGGDDAYTNSQVNSLAGGEVGFWGTGEIVWVVCRSNLGAPLRVYPDMAPGGGAAAAGATLPATGTNGQFFWYREGAGKASILYIWGPAKDNTEDWNEIYRTV
jgi:hypothetical protein